MKREVEVVPSLLAADVGRLQEEVASVAAWGARWLHVDVMDGSFVPPITFGTNVVSCLRKTSSLLLDVHLMVVEPERHVEPFHVAGAHRLIVHQEASPHLHRTLTACRALGMESGVALNPGTPVETVFDLLGECDVVLLMTVNPGWGGQSFIPGCLEKIRRLAARIEQEGCRTAIEVDGGINAVTAAKCRAVGATVLVAGTSIFGAVDRAAAMRSLL